MKYRIPLLTVAVAATVASPCIVYADAISPHIRDTGKVYSKEAPKTHLYGTGMGGRAAEASMLRFEAERDLQDGNLEDAVAKAKLACQFDPADPGTHTLLARALTRTFFSKKGEPDEKLLRECLYEWQLLWHHDSDQISQLEAKGQARRLMRIARAIAKQRREEQEAKLRAKEQLAKERKEQRLASREGKAGESTEKKTAVTGKLAASKATTSDETADVDSETVPLPGNPKQQTGPVSPSSAPAVKPTAAPKTAGSGDLSQADEQDDATKDSAQIATKKKRFVLF